MHEPNRRRTVLPGNGVRMQILYRRTPWPLLGIAGLFLVINAMIPQAGVFFVLPNLLLSGAVLSMLQGANGGLYPGQKTAFFNGIHALRTGFEELGRLAIIVLLLAFLVEIILLVIEHAFLIHISAAELLQSADTGAASWMQRGFRTDFMDLLTVGIPGIVPALYLAMRDDLDPMEALWKGFQAITEDHAGFLVFASIMPVSLVLAVVYLSVPQGIITSFLVQIAFTALWLLINIYGYVFCDQNLPARED